MVDPRQGCQLEPLQVGLEAVTWPDHIPRPVPSLGDLRAGGESHSPLLPDFCPDHQNRNSQEGRLQCGRHVGCCQGFIPPSHTGAGWGALGIKKVRPVGARPTAVQQRRRVPPPWSPCPPAGCAGHSTTLALHSLLSALGFTPSTGLTCMDAGGRTSLYLLSEACLAEQQCLHLIWTGGRSQRTSPSGCPIPAGNSYRGTGVGLCCAWRLLPG